MLIKHSLHLLIFKYNYPNMYRRSWNHIQFSRKNRQRFVYICTLHQDEEKIYRLKNKKEGMSSRHELQKHSERWKLKPKSRAAWMLKYKRGSLQMELWKNILRNKYCREGYKTWRQIKDVNNICVKSTKHFIVVLLLVFHADIYMRIQKF